MSRILGAILAGGESRRFGADKAEALLGGRTLIEHAERAIARQVDATIIVGRGPIGDRPHAGLGPLGGLNAALHHARAHGLELVASIGCDTPVLPADLVERLHGAGAPCYLAAMPIIGLWPSALADRLDAHLARGPSRSMRSWAEAVGAAPVTLDIAIANINTPADLAAIIAAHERHRA
ncbi:molybdenum cofactor guanylyltransferase [Sphingomonas gilva]|uniref:Molybdenum cofactor guanylyltransferase n=1 Tax=Sphingomonas gilva TaxID=2305907 RepID=A0A396RME3_9SPHN|nr:molybdenum cofactor guanylyltransferase [Sphingomonas gilva]RHW17560.1 molybdenum cofactor guanylyltransferase [Sphingomonas gilva]